MTECKLVGTRRKITRNENPSTEEKKLPYDEFIGTLKYAFNICYGVQH